MTPNNVTVLYYNSKFNRVTTAKVLGSKGGTYQSAAESRAFLSILAPSLVFESSCSFKLVASALEFLVDFNLVFSHWGATLF
jgi:hypothetical protein